MIPGANVPSWKIAGDALGLRISHQRMPATGRRAVAGLYRLVGDQRLRACRSCDRRSGASSAGGTRGCRGAAWSSSRRRLQDAAAAAAGAREDRVVRCDGQRVREPEARGGRRSRSRPRTPQRERILWRAVGAARCPSSRRRTRGSRQAAEWCRRGRQASGHRAVLNGAAAGGTRNRASCAAGLPATSCARLTAYGADALEGAGRAQEPRVLMYIASGHTPVFPGSQEVHARRERPAEGTSRPDRPTWTRRRS